MDLMKLLRSLEEFVFEAIALLFFYPRTMLRITFQPLAAMRYAEQEEAADKSDPYDDAVSPPLLLLLTLLLANSVGLALHVKPPAGASDLTRALLDSPQNLLLFRSLLFSVIPLTAAVVLVRWRGTPASRSRLRQPFFAQCYLTSPFALVVSIALIVSRLPAPGFAMAGAIACALAAAWMVGVQAVWFRFQLGLSRPVSLAIAVGLLAWACACVLVVVLLVAIF